MADRNRRFALAAIALPFFLLMMSGLTRAATITVTTLADPAGVSGTCSLRQAITNANGKDQSGSTNCTAGTGTDTIVFSVTGKITLGSALPAISNTSPGSLTIDGSGQAITLDGADTYQIFNINSGATLNLQFLTLAHGFVLGNEEGFGAGGAVFNEGGTLTVTNCTFSDNQSIGSAVSGSGNGEAGAGGAIDSTGTLTVTDSTFSGNQATGGAGVSSGVGGGQGLGGAIFNDGAMTVTGSTFSANKATGGGGEDAGGGDGNGGAIAQGQGVGPATVINSTFSANQAIGGGGDPSGDGNGGAIAAVSFGGTLTVTNCTFSGNQTTAGAGPGGKAVGGAIDNDGSLSIVAVKGTILSSSTGGNCGGSAVTDVGHNISDDGSCGFTVPPSGTSLNNSTTLNLDPAGLQNNGGPTNTIALEGNSEAVDFIPVADCTDQSPTPLPLKIDQRGFPRPDPGNPEFCDAGAFELQTTPIVISAAGERLQIVNGSTPSGDQLNTSFTFTENATPTCDAADDPFNGVDITIRTGSCAALGSDAVEFFLGGWVVHTVNHQTYGTTSLVERPVILSARMVELPTPAAPACGEWTINLEFTGISLAEFGHGPFALIVTNGDGDQGCLDVTNAIVGNQIIPPTRTVRRGVRR
jgi:CSLREA domain-containing protein